MKANNSTQTNVALLGASLLFCGGVFLALDYLLSTPVVRLMEQEKPYVSKDGGWYELKRSFVGKDAWGTAIYDVTTDEFGFRVGSRKPGRGDIIILGDSFVYGINGSSNETFVGLFDASTPKKVLNAGVPSYSPTAYLHSYTTALADSALNDKHTVVVALDIGDVQDEATRWREGTDHPVLLPTSGPPTSGPNYWGDRLHLTTRIYRHFRYTLLSPNPFDKGRSAFTWEDWKVLDSKPYYLEGYAPLGVRGGLDRVANKMRKLAALAREHQASFFVLIYPWPAQIKHPDKFSWESYVAALCRDVQCSGVINTLPVFRAYAAKNRDWFHELYFQGDVHFNARGNEIIFRELKAALDGVKQAEGPE